MSATVDVTVRGGTVRLTMAARDAADLGTLQKGLKSLAERLGHPTCASGCDILHIGMERSFTLSRAGGVEPALNPQPLPPIEAFVAGPQPDPRHTVTVAIPDKVNRDINALTRVTASVLNKLGCPQCCSGFDILFRREADFLGVDANLNVHGFGRFA